MSLRIKTPDRSAAATGTIETPTGAAGTDPSQMEAPTASREDLIEYADANGKRPRVLLTLSRLYTKFLAVHPDDSEISARRADITERLAKLDTTHLGWFGEIPDHLLMKVNGSTDRAAFLHVGESVSGLLKEELSILPEAENILDFGVGLSRVLWPMMQEYPEADFTGFDVDPMMIEQSEKLASVSEARTVHSTQPIEAGTIDATYVISVFTHLMTTVDFWLAEIYRVLTDRGQAFITYHDETLYEELRAKGTIPTNAPAECRERLLVGVGAEGSTNLAVFYDTPYWNQCLERFFIVEKTAPRGLHGHQSFSVVRRRPDVVVDHDRFRYEYLCKLEEELYDLRRAKKLMF